MNNIKHYAIALIIASVMILPGCSTQQIKDAILPATHVVLLEREADMMTEALQSMVLPPAKKVELEDAIAKLESVRVKLNNVADGDLNQPALIQELVANDLLDTIRKNFNIIRIIVSDYYGSKKIAIPQAYLNYNRSAVSAYRYVATKLDKESSIDWREVSGLLGLVLRTYATSKGIPTI